MNLRTITLLAIASTLYLVGSSALKLLSSLLPISIPIKCILIGLFMGMFPRRTAMIFYTITCGLLVIETLVNIPSLIITFQTGVTLASAIKMSPLEPPTFFGGYSGILWVVAIVSSATVLVKYRMAAIKAFFSVILNLTLILVYSLAPFVVFSFIVFRLSGLSIDNAMASPILLAYIFVLWDIYITVTGPLIARWMFRRIGIYRRIPKTGQ